MTDFSTIELLAPAGGRSQLEAAVRFGADAVYLAADRFGMRQRAENFTLDDIPSAVAFAHAAGVKVYVTVNTLMSQADIAALPPYLEALDASGADALIVSDLGAFSLAKRYAPHMELHVSTQASVMNAEAARTWHDLGASRVVVAREMSVEDIAELRAQAPRDLEIEAFVHGAMCMAYSGRCMLSMYLTGKSANCGSCTHPCRWEYYIVEKQRKDDFMPVEEDERGTYIFNSKDLCMLPYLDRFIESGVTSLKIEGRMKSIHYVATATKAYREAVDMIQGGGDFAGAIPALMRELNGIGERDYTTGFYLDEQDPQMMQYEPSKVEKDIRFVGKILETGLEGGRIRIEQRNKFLLGDTLEVLQPKGPNQTLKVEHIENKDGDAVESAPHPREILTLNGIPGLVPGALLRIRS